MMAQGVRDMAEGDRLYIVRDRSGGWGAPAIPDRELLALARRGAITPVSELRDPITKWTGTAWEHPVLRAAFVQAGVAGPEEFAAGPTGRRPSVGGRGVVAGGAALAAVAAAGVAGWFWWSAHAAAVRDGGARTAHAAAVGHGGVQAAHHAAVRHVLRHGSKPHGPETLR
jgi:hypothetical protein